MTVDETVTGMESIDIEPGLVWETLGNLKRYTVQNVEKVSFPQSWPGEKTVSVVCAVVVLKKKWKEYLSMKMF